MKVAPNEKILSEEDVEDIVHVISESRSSRSNTVPVAASLNLQKVKVNNYALAEHDAAELQAKIQHVAVLKSRPSLPSVLASIGVSELRSFDLYKALIVEFLGTATYVYMHIAIVAACQLYSYPPMQIGIGHAILLSFFILQFEKGSGAYFNSMVTLASMTTGHLLPVRGLLYVVVQIFGATAGAEVMRQCISDDLARSIFLGGCNTGNVTDHQALAIEFFFSLTFLFTVYGTAFNRWHRAIYGPVLPPFLIGCMLGLIIFASASLGEPPFSGAGANPSLCLGTAWAYSNVDHVLLRTQWIYWAGPSIAIIINTLMYVVAPPHHDEEELQEALKKQS